jgi:hypothetical protein
MVYGRVYAIRSHQTTDIYIGSTKQILSKRMSDHRKEQKLYLKTNKKYMTSFDIIKYKDAYIEILFEGEFESINALRAKEGEYIREMECINKRIEGRTQQEYYEDNKPHILEEAKEYYRENKPHILERVNKYYEIHKEEKHEYNHKYYENNKKELTEYQSKYREIHKEQIKEKSCKKNTCECGGHFTHTHKSTHEKTKKHQLFLQNKV